MQVGVPREVIDGEGRVGIEPNGVRALIEAGHPVSVESGAGLMAGYSDEAYTEVGATLVSSPAEVYRASFIVKVKEPQESETPLLRRGQILFCYLHLAANPSLERFLKEEGVLAVAYETVTGPDGGLPLLAPMSAMAGRIAVQEGAHLLGVPQGGKGVLIDRAKVVILGAGQVGFHAAQMATQMGAQVTVLDQREGALQRLRVAYPSAETQLTHPDNIRKACESADLVVGAVLIPGEGTPKLLTRKVLKQMERGSVFVDVAIDQGGCAETSRPTSHSNPTYVEEGILHYCVPNMPGAFPRSASDALCQATLPYIFQIASGGVTARSR